MACVGCEEKARKRAAAAAAQSGPKEVVVGKIVLYDKEAEKEISVDEPVAKFLLGASRYVHVGGEFTPDPAGAQVGKTQKTEATAPVASAESPQGEQ